jgi:putative addiction module CopG family antidote
MTVTLSSRAEEIVREMVETGRYASTDDVIAQALIALDYQERLERFRAMLQVGIDEDDRGEADEWTPELRERLHQQALARYRRGDQPDPDVLP